MGANAGSVRYCRCVASTLQPEYCSTAYRIRKDLGAAVERAVYCVCFRGGGWAIRFNDKHFGPCASREQAIAVAISAASKAFIKGLPAQVMVKEDRFYRTVWLNGNERVLTAA